MDGSELVTQGIRFSSLINIELTDSLVAEAQKYSKAKTKRALVEEALATFIAVKHEDFRRRSCKDRIESVK